MRDARDKARCAPAGVRQSSSAPAIARDAVRRRPRRAFHGHAVWDRCGSCRELQEMAPVRGLQKSAGASALLRRTARRRPVRPPRRRVACSDQAPSPSRGDGLGRERRNGADGETRRFRSVPDQAVGVVGIGAPACLSSCRERLVASPASPARPEALPSAPESRPLAFGRPARGGTRRLDGVPRGETSSTLETHARG